MSHTLDTCETDLLRKGSDTTALLRKGSDTLAAREHLGWTPCAGTSTGIDPVLVGYARSQCEKLWSVWSELPRAIVILDLWPPGYVDDSELKGELMRLMA